jgi:hypothetical protein
MSNNSPRIKLCPLGGMFAPEGEYSLLFRRMEGRTEDLHSLGSTSPLGNKVHPSGTTLALGVNFTPREQSSPLGNNFSPGGQSSSLGARLNTGLGIRTAVAFSFMPVVKPNYNISVGSTEGSSFKELGVSKRLHGM